MLLLALIGFFGGLITGIHRAACPCVTRALPVRCPCPRRCSVSCTASEARIVLSGSGTVRHSADGKATLFTVRGTPKSYPLVKTADIDSGTLRVSVSPGVEAFCFTFG